MPGMTRAASAREVVVELAPRPQSGHEARRAVLALADHLQPQTMAKVRLLVTELVVAALAPAENRRLRLTARLADRAVRCEIATAEAGALLARQARPRSWSLFLVNRFADAWGADAGTVWFEVEEPPPRRFERAAG
jgi:ParB-like chromosome segregation protein Spo0J